MLEIKAKSGFNPLAAIKIAKYCRAHKIDILDAHSSKAHTLGLLVKALAPNLKLIVHRRVDNPPGRDPISIWKYRTDKVDKFIAISTAIREILLKAGVSSDKVALARSAVPYKETSNAEKADAQKKLRAQFKISDDTALFGNASAISHQKAYDVLLKACARLRDAGINFHCLIAGAGPQLAEMEDLRIKLSLQKHVTFVGFIKEITSFLRGLDFFTIPSANEGLGTIIMDATYCGLPVIGSKVGGIPEMIEHKVSGLLIRPGNDAELFDCIKEFIGNPEQAHLYQEACKKKLLRDFSLQAMVHGNLDVYKSILP